jgi:hypothetical protein
MGVFAREPIIMCAEAAGQVRILRLPQPIEPLALGRIDTIPLAKVACRSLADGEDNDRRPNSPL